MDDANAVSSTTTPLVLRFCSVPAEPPVVVELPGVGGIRVEPFLEAVETPGLGEGETAGVDKVETAGVAKVGTAGVDKVETQREDEMDTQQLHDMEPPEPEPPTAWELARMEQFVEGCLDELVARVEDPAWSVNSSTETVNLHNVVEQKTGASPVSSRTRAKTGPGLPKKPTPCVSFPTVAPKRRTRVPKAVSKGSKRCSPRGQALKLPKKAVANQINAALAMNNAALEKTKLRLENGIQRSRTEKTMLRREVIRLQRKVRTLTVRQEDMDVRMVDYDARGRNFQRARDQ